MRPAKPRLRRIAARGLRCNTSLSERSRLKAELFIPARAAKRLGIPRRIGVTTTEVAWRTVAVRIKLSKRARRGLRKVAKTRLELRLTAVDRSGNSRRAIRKIAARK